MSLIGCSTTVSWCEGVPVSLKLLFKLGVGAVRQSILARIILCCVCMCVMHVFGSTRAIWRHLLLVMSYCHRPRTLQVHRFSLRMVQFTATDVTSNPTPQGLLRRRTRRLWSHHVQHVCVEPFCRFRPSQRPKIRSGIPSRPRTRTPALPSACRFPGVGRKDDGHLWRSGETGELRLRPFI